MDIKLQEFEVINMTSSKSTIKKMSDQEINNKYEKGELRIVTEQGSFKLDLITAIFAQPKYNLRPEFQRRITWDTKKRSRLIESFIMNIPVPPVFLYEDDFSSYVVMDGLQRISAIMDFYNNYYALEGLEEWAELNGKKYSQLPQKVREGIDRRQISVITLLKESADDKMSADKMKKMVFERLNTGGVQLEDQEIRNALYAGKFNDFCFKMSENETFKKLWGISGITGDENINQNLLDAEENMLAAKNKMYRRMYDVELVLRYFAMRNVEVYSGRLSKFLDSYLIKANDYADEEMEYLKNAFELAINNADKLFGEKAFCVYRKEKGKNGWSQPQNMIYDAVMLALSGERLNFIIENTDAEKNLKLLEEFYLENETVFNGKKQSKNDIMDRCELIENFIIDKILGK